MEINAENENNQDDEKKNYDDEFGNYNDLTKVCIFYHIIF